MNNLFTGLLSDRRRIYELSVGITLIGLMTVLIPTRWLDSFEYLFFDLRFKVRPQVDFPPQINVIGVDEASLDVFGRWPWPRDRHSALLDLLKQKPFRPAVIGYDALFENKNLLYPKSDEDLVYQTKTFKNPVIMSYFCEKGPAAIVEQDELKEKRLENFALPLSAYDSSAIDEADKVSLPYQELADVSQLAFVNTPQDPDGRTRYSQLVMKYRDKIYPSMDLLAAAHYLGATLEDIQLVKNQILIRSKKVGDIIIPINEKGQMLINYYGDFSRLAKYSFIEILNFGKAWRQGEDYEALKKFKDQIILVGVTAQGIGDRRVTPFTQYEPGVFLHAQTVANIIQKNFLVRAHAWTSYLSLWILGLCAAFLAMFLPISKSLPALLLLELLYFSIACLFFMKGLWIDVAVQATTMVNVFFGITSFRYFTALQELKKTQEQLIQSAKMASLGQLSAGIAHEFRNIMNAIYLNVECLNQPNLSEEKMKKYLGMLIRIMENSNLILNGLLTFARKSESVKSPGNLKKTVENTLLLVEKEMMRHQIDVIHELEEVPETSFDAGQISQVVMNLMNNARDALRSREEGKQVTLKLRNLADKLQLDIGDNGSGIPPQVLKRLFEPFVTSKPAGKGTGLGLSVCHGIIRNHQGDIKVTTVQGQGTTWHILLPKN